MLVEWISMDIISNLSVAGKESSVLKHRVFVRCHCVTKMAFLHLDEKPTFLPSNYSFINNNNKKNIDRNYWNWKTRWH